MIVDRLRWVSHEGMQIFSVDVEPNGLRFATGGGDHKVRIWDAKSVGRQMPKGGSATRLLATLRDHFGSVNCVRWAKHSRFVASGSDDQAILIHERKPGSGRTEFGTGEPPDVENWKVVMTLRGHTADVVDLNWSPDDSTLASGSLDNTIHIWNMSNGICTAVLRGHASLVKGVTWDPIGSFIASQSDDKSVIIWRTTDWTQAHKTDGHWTKSLGSTFFRRLAWSPCGHFITTTHGFQKPRHSAPVLERGEWSATFDFLGHNAPVIVVKFNHSMFRKSTSNTREAKTASVRRTNGSSKAGDKESQPYNVIAIGSQDRTITVWTTASPRPLFVAKHFFQQSVVDLSWSPDGYSLFACSLDGTVAYFQFDVKELGYRLTDTELDELKRNRYGDVRGRQANLAESPAQLLLEAASAKMSTSKRTTKDVLQKNMTIQTSTDTGTGMNTFKSKTVGGKKNVGSGGHASNKVTPVRVINPVKQREYRCPDGRKRIIPEAVGMPSQQETTSGFELNSAEQKNNISNNNNNNNNNNTGVVHADVAVQGVTVRRSLGGSSDNERAGVNARAALSESLVIEKVPVSAGTDGSINVEHVGILKNPSSFTASSTLSIRVFDNKEGEDMVPVCLEARPKEHAANDIVVVGNTFMIKETEITCTRGTQTLWSDRISSKVTVLAGNANFWAVGCEDGCLQVYTKCGRRAMPAMMTGSASVFIDCDESWKLLLVTKKGSLYIWDLFSRSCALENSLTSLLTSNLNSSGNDAGTIKVISAKLSKSGFPLVVLATRHAFLFDMSLRCWLRVADDCFPASNFASSWNLGLVHSGELAGLQVDVRKFLARKPGWSRVTDDGVQTRAHLEAQLASALALQSPDEYRQCLLSYTRFLAREADESRLREVCESFLGPPTGMVESASSESKNPTWDPCVLGMKKHKLLREDILPAMASNRKVQRLLNEFMDLLSEYGDTDTNPEQKSLALPTSRTGADQSNVITANQVSNSPAAVDKVDTNMTTKNQIDPSVPARDGVDSGAPVGDPMDMSSYATDQQQSAVPVTDQSKSDLAATDVANSVPPAKNQVS